jgi:RHS repeat-associated protein
MKSTKTPFGIGKSFAKFVQNLMVVVMVQSTVLSTSQEMLYDYFHNNRHEPLRYKGDADLVTTPDIALPNKGSNTMPSVLPSHSHVQRPYAMELAFENVFKSDIDHGVIGVDKDNPLDSAADNIFKIQLNRLPTAGEKAYLVYDLYGVQDFTAVSRSINDRFATGGYAVKKQPAWSTQREEINADWLKFGENRITFGLPGNSYFRYEVKNLRVEIVKDNRLAMLVLQKPQIRYAKDNKLYVKGFVKSQRENIRVMLDETPVQVTEGEYEGVIVLTESQKQRGFAMLRAYDDTGVLGQEMVSLDNLAQADRVTAIEKTFDRISSPMATATGGYLATDGASITVGEGALASEANIQIIRLRKADLPPMESGMVNVTKGGGYRFLPDGLKFEKPVAIELAYDEKLIPAGYSAHDIQTFYFNTEIKNWVMVKRDSLIEGSTLVRSSTTHFTDYINGIIQVPESPETAAFTPTMMNDIKVADPSAEMTLISPPEASQKGDVGIDYPFKLPAGRNGMAPKLGLQYSSEGGNGWLGVGWSLNIPAITLDTRWGVPVFDAQKETEMYMLNGEQLMYPKRNNQDWMPNRHQEPSAGVYQVISTNRNLSGPKIFTPRVQGSFDRIERFGNSPQTYYWKVTSTDGTISWYGTDATSQYTDNSGAAIRKPGTNEIVQWGLYMVEDVNGNNIKYKYFNDDMTAFSGEDTNLNGGWVFRVKEILYTGHNGSDGLYRVEFRTDREIDPNAPIKEDASINARLGLKQIDVDLLKEVTIWDQGAVVRRYKMDYTEGQFYKNLLAAVSENYIVGGDEKEFYRHVFDYHGIQEQCEGCLFIRKPMVSMEDSTPKYDLANIPNMLNTSRINSTQTVEYGFDIRAGFGFEIRPFIHSHKPNRTLTIGTSGGMSFTNDKGIITLIDVDGNGLEDILYKSGSGLKYLPHTMNAGMSSHSFGPPRSMHSILNFAKSEGSTTHLPLECFDLQFGGFFAGVKRFTSKSETPTYLTDGNSDGLIDVVRNDKVYFNYIDPSTNEPTFTTASEKTPNMVVTSEEVYEYVEDADPDLTAFNYDAVKVWMAPSHGVAQIKDFISYVPGPAPSKVYYSIETVDIDTGQPVRLFTTALTVSHISELISLPSTIRVAPGQMIYFRLHRNTNRGNEKVTMNPEIVFSPLAGIATADQNGISTQNYKYGDAFALSKDDAIEVEGNGDVRFEWNPFYVSGLSDTVTFKIVLYKVKKTNPEDIDDDILYQKVCDGPTIAIPNPSTLVKADITNNFFIETITIPSDRYAYIKVLVESNSNVNVTTIPWRLKYDYTPDPSLVTLGIQPKTYYPIPQYTIYPRVSPYIEHQFQDADPPACNLTTPTWDTVNSNTNFGGRFNRNVTYQSGNNMPIGFTVNDNGYFRMVIKTGNRTLGAQTMRISDGELEIEEDNYFTHHKIPIYQGNIQTLASPIPLSVEIYIDGVDNFTLYNKYLNALTNCETPLLIGYDWSQAVTHARHYRAAPVNVYYNPFPHLGPMHNNWGQFFYNQDLDWDQLPVDANGFRCINPAVVATPLADVQADMVGPGAFNFGGCNTPACFEGVIDGMVGAPGETTDFSQYDEADVEGLLDNMPVNSTNAPQMPLFAANAVTKRTGPAINSPWNDKWMGITDEAYSAKLSARNGSFEESEMADVFAVDDTDLPEAAIDADTGMWAIKKRNRSASHSYTIGYNPATIGFSKSDYSSMKSDFMDLNGDGYPEIVTNKFIQKTSMTGGHMLADNNPNHLYGNINESASENLGLTVSHSFLIAGRAKEDPEHPKSQKHDLGSPTGRISLDVNLSGENETTELFIDVNGDGLADRVIKQGSLYKFVLNANQPGSPSPTMEGYSALKGFESTPSALSGSIGVNQTIADGTLNSLNLPFDLDVSVGISQSGGNTTSTFVDINADGLQDIIVLNGTNGYVLFNKGHKFSAPVLIQAVSQNAQVVSPSLQNDTRNIALGASLGASYFLGTPIFILIIITPFFVLVMPLVHLKGGATLTGNASMNISDTNTSFRDFDADGYADIVVKEEEELEFYGSLSQLANKLKTVRNPLGGSFDVSYMLTEPSYANPSSKWVMKSVITKDGYDKVNDGRDYYVRTFEYANGKYDRRERLFYGFGTVKTHIYDEDTQGSNILRTTISEYHTENYFTKGLLKKQTIVNENGAMFSETVNTYAIRRLALMDNNSMTTVEENLQTFDVGGTKGRQSGAVVLKATVNRLYEFGSTPMTTETQMTYDNKGRVVAYDYLGGPGTADDYKVDIIYHQNPGFDSLHLLNVPGTVQVTSNGNMYRSRYTEVDGLGHVVVVHAVIDNSGAEAETKMDYDAYGNLKRIEYPEHHNCMAHPGAAERMFYDYKYDSIYHKYIEATTDAYGYESTAHYHSRNDKVDWVTDRSGNMMKYRYDDFDRTTAILAPKEIPLDIPTIEFIYFPYHSDLQKPEYENCQFEQELFMPFAVTRHYDIFHPDNHIETITFMDGLARVQQVKKDIEMPRSIKGVTTYREFMSVSGAVTYDAFGRGIKQYSQWYEIKDCKLNYKFKENLISPYSVVTEMDAMDRPVRITDDPVSTPTRETRYQYSIATDNLGNVCQLTRSEADQGSSLTVINETYKDDSGKITSVVENGSLLTSFEYDPVGQLMKYTDADPLSTSYEYDWLGRRIIVRHPDNGKTIFTYNAASQLIALETAKLQNVSERINYKYHFGRKTDAIYPIVNGNANIANVHYEYHAAAPGKGLVSCLSDATGKQEFTYGMMGEVVHNARTIVGPNIPTRVFHTEFNYDSFNRTEQIIYPDGEKVHYKYDWGGNMNRMIGTVNNADFNYVDQIDYDHYEQRTYMRYGNKTENHYIYRGDTRQIEKLSAWDATNNPMFDNHYEYDGVGNILSIDNTGVSPTAGHFGGSSNHKYSYDLFNRLVGAEGSFTGDPAQAPYGNDISASYGLHMEYNNSHGIAIKKQDHIKNGATFTPNTYDNKYEYNGGTHQLKHIEDLSIPAVTHGFSYDANGNMTDHTSPNGTRKMYWDESNRLRVVEEDKGMNHYLYDAAGERVLKANSNIETVDNNGTVLSSTAWINAYTTYPSQFMVIQPNARFSKHYYVGSQRVVSRMGDDKADQFDSAEATPYCAETTKRSLAQAQKDDLLFMLKESRFEKVAFMEYKPSASEQDADDQTEPSLERAAPGDGGDPEPMLAPVYFYHPDHLGSSTFLTNFNGNAYQFYLSLPFGETLAEQKPLGLGYETPYKFTAKELDEETGLHYFGARYYHPGISNWLSVDPLFEHAPNKNPYHYCSQNPINRTDPTGMCDDPNCTHGLMKRAWDSVGRLFGAWGYAEKKPPVAQKKPSYIAAVGPIEEGPIAEESFADKYVRFMEEAGDWLRRQEGTSTVDEDLIQSINIGGKFTVDYRLYSKEYQFGLYSTSENSAGLYFMQTISIGAKVSSDKGINFLNPQSFGSASFFATANTGNPFNQPTVVNDVKLVGSGSVTTGTPIRLYGSSKFSLLKGTRNTSFGIEVKAGDPIKAEGGVFHTTTILHRTTELDLRGNGE